MPYPSGGRADKYGNTYERNYIIYQILKILRDEIISIKKEPEGDDEKSTDLILTGKLGCSSCTNYEELKGKKWRIIVKCNKVEYVIILSYDVLLGEYLILSAYKK